MKKKVIVRAPVLSVSGYGTHARLVLNSLRQYEEYFDIYLININWGHTSWLSEENDDRRWYDSLIMKTNQHLQEGKKFDVSVQVTIPNEWEKIADYNIGVTAGIEVDKISPHWVEKSSLVDKIIVVSEHAKSGFEDAVCQIINRNTKEVVKSAKIDAPITVIGYPVENTEPEELDISLKDDFNFLTIAQWGPRKNIESLLVGFLEEFKDQQVGLVLKLSIRNNTKVDREHAQRRIKTILDHFPNRKCNVYLLHGNLTDGQMKSLYTNEKIKCLISLSHGEGFGIPLFEAAYNGLPIITTNWSGQCDFLNYVENGSKKPLFSVVDHELKEVQQQAVWQGVIESGTKWAFPIKDSYRKRLRQMLYEYPRFLLLATKLKKHILNDEKFSADFIHRKYAEEIYGGSLRKISSDDIPMVSIFTSVFNGGEHIEGFLKNITEQSVFSSKCELVLVHPKTSKDFQKEKDCIEKYMSIYKDNIKYQILEDDPGIYACWNTAIYDCTGEYIYNANLDDRRSKNFTENMAKKLLTSGADLVYCDAFITDKYGETFENNTSNGKRYFFPEPGLENLKMINYPHASPMYKKELHAKNGYYEEKYRSAADWEFHLRCCVNGASHVKHEEILYLYCFNPVGISTNPENFSWKREEEREVFNQYKEAKNMKAL